MVIAIRDNHLARKAKTMNDKTNTDTEADNEDANVLPVNESSTVCFTDSEDGITRVVVGETMILRVTDTEFTVNTGGKFTSFIKRRLNQAARTLDIPFVIFSDDKDWNAFYDRTLYPIGEDGVVTIPIVADAAAAPEAAPASE